MSFCTQCGARLDDKSNYCSKCGAPVKRSQSMLKNPNVDPVVPTLPRITPNSKSTRNIFIGIIVCAVLVGVFLVSNRSSSVQWTDEPCDWCNHQPTVAYRMSDGSYSYVCGDCQKECAWCGDPATRHYENVSRTMVFVCEDCYEDLHGN